MSTWGYLDRLALSAINLHPVLANLHTQKGQLCSHTAQPLVGCHDLLSCLWRIEGLPLSRPAWLQADRILVKFVSTGFKPCCCISSRNCLATLHLPKRKNPPIIEPQDTTSWLGKLSNTFRASSKLPDLAYRSTRVFPMAASDSSSLLIICLWMNLPHPMAPTLPQAFRILKKYDTVWLYALLLHLF